MILLALHADTPTSDDPLFKVSEGRPLRLNCLHKGLCYATNFHLTNTKVSRKMKRVLDRRGRMIQKEVRIERSDYGREEI